MAFRFRNKTKSMEEIRAEWQLLYKDLVRLKALKKTNPKKFAEMQIRLRDVIYDIGEKLKDIALSYSDIKELTAIRESCAKYQSVAAAA